MTATIAYRHGDPSRLDRHETQVAIDPHGEYAVVSTTTDTTRVADQLRAIADTIGGVS
ncbi:hypothetical protein [Salana multivorans]